MNILFVMYDQLRFDYLGCAGHPHLKTPNFDRVAARGMRFDRAYCQSPVCGASRMSFYTGRYTDSHGATWNNYPLKVGEMTLGDHLRPLGMDCWLIGKTHMAVDDAGLDRLGISREGVIGARVAECGFDVWIRDDGLWAEGPDGFYDRRRSPYNEYLKAQGYGGDNPWHDHANSAAGADGRVASGFLMQNAAAPAHIRQQDSETPWLTSRAIDFIEDRRAADRPWLAHLSYIKPHWPYIVPAPWHDLYGPEHVLPAVRSTAERQDPHPVFGAFMNGKIGRAFHREDVRETVIPAYMGLIAQCDAELGRLLDYLDATGQADSTMIVLTSDHGDYLGDHWMGEKDLFHDPSVRIPMIVLDPRPDADATRGQVCNLLVESIDLAATFIEAAGGTVPGHIVEGRSLLPLLRGETVAWRDAAISEYDYSGTPAATALGLAPRDCRLMMVATDRWKMIHAEGGMRPMLFDLRDDPRELVDLGADPAQAGTIARLYGHLNAWARRMSQRTTISDATIAARRGASGRKGVILGAWDETDADDVAMARYRGPVGPLPG